MPIESNQIKFMKSHSVNDTASNGGRMSDVEAANSVKNNLWPDVPASERAAGSIRFRKLFIKIASPDNLILRDARVFIQTPTPAGDRVVFFAGTQRDVMANVSGVAQIQYGTGMLNADVAIGASVITVNVEDPDDTIFRPGQMIRLSNKTSVHDLTHSEDFIRIASTPGSVTWNGSLATLTLAAGATLANAYPPSDTLVASVLEAGDIIARTDSWGLATSAGRLGGWNGAGTPPATLADLQMVDSIAGIEQTWTLIFTSASAFSCVGDTVGQVGGGSILEDFAPNNPAYSRPYFTIPASLFGGIWAAGNALTFTTHPAALPIWEKRVVPPGTDSLSGNRVTIGLCGESE
ncbi:MAG: hypothetical protein HQM02_05445 [Magnetococcales bacterium]|nr:hypothetical protein [Magnetococcales bacterium]